MKMIVRVISQIKQRPSSNGSVRLELLLCNANDTEMDDLEIRFD